MVPEKKFVHATFRSKNPYKGPPSPELDHSWHQLFVNSNIRVSASDLEKINKTSVPVGDDEGGYYAIPGKLTYCGQTQGNFARLTAHYLR